MTATRQDVTVGAHRSRLARVLTANGWFSVVSGVVLLVGAAVLDEPFDVAAWLIAATGVGLVPYGLWLMWASRGPTVDRAVAVVASGADLAWVLGAGVVLASAGTMSTVGKWALGIVTLVVLDFAILQIRELRRS